MKLTEVLKNAVEMGASDIHVVSGLTPSARIHGEIVSCAEAALTDEELSKGIDAILPAFQAQRFKDGKEIDCGFSIDGVGRFRVNIYKEKRGCSIAFRVIAEKIPSPEAIGLNESITNLTKFSKGLVLVTGPTGSGKSTLIACLIDIITRERKDHIITIEDPIEFHFEDNNCLVSQREVGLHTETFAHALKYALRQDPDVVLVGELRDLETIAMALTMAETGHLVFATLHTTDAAQTVDRVIDVFPAYQQQQIRMQLSGALKAVISQNLLPTVDGKGRVAAREVMIVTSAISNLIREGNTHQLYSAIQTGRGAGMCLLEDSLAKLCNEGLISQETAMAKANNPEALKTYLNISE